MTARGRRPRALSIVLHSHMPYVEGFDTWPFGEEWLWEAVATVYLPLLEVPRRCALTVGLTPVLCDQLEALDGDAGVSPAHVPDEMRPLVHSIVVAAPTRTAATSRVRCERRDAAPADAS